MKYVGIDPGNAGGIAIIGNGPLQLFTMPTLTAGKSKKEIDEEAVHRILCRISGELPAPVAAIERTYAVKGQSASGAHTFGLGVGLLRGILCGLRIPYQIVRSQEWRKTLMAGQPKGKQANIAFAQRLFPGASIGRHDGKADALLIAEYLRRTTTPCAGKTL